ncbi:MAG TPA: cytochrome c [Verrucomicrobiae bacterium]|nr:cytochrome c [Verrucomicrobiae bacterium]
MKLSLELKGTILGILTGCSALGIAFAASELFQPKATQRADANHALEVPPEGTLANQGYKLFLLNCAHCHGDDARGDEGPDLHDVTKSDQRIANLIQNGVKDQMPKFSAKLTDADVQALIAFIRALRN